MSRHFFNGGRMKHLIDNVENYLAIFGAFTALMTIIAALTPSKKDDKIVSCLDKIGAVADRLGVQIKARR